MLVKSFQPDLKSDSLVSFTIITMLLFIIQSNAKDLFLTFGINSQDSLDLTWLLSCPKMMEPNLVEMHLDLHNIAIVNYLDPC